MDPAAPTLARRDTADAEPTRPRRRRDAVAVRSVGVLASGVLLAVVVLASLAIGSVSIPWPTVIDSLVAFDGSNEHLIVRTLRLPRTIIGLGVGSALAVAGVAMQAVTRNALASPTILGVNAGAAFAVVTAVFVLDVVTASMYLWFAFAGALVVSALVHAIAAAGRGGATPVRLALAGAVMTALLSSWTSGILVFNQRTLDEVRFWFAGSIAGRDLDVFWNVLPFLAVGLVAVALLARQFDTLALGDDVATSLGQQTGRVRSPTPSRAPRSSSPSAPATAPWSRPPPDPGPARPCEVPALTLTSESRCGHSVAGSVATARTPAEDHRDRDPTAATHAGQRPAAGRVR